MATDLARPTRRSLEIDLIWPPSATVCRYCSNWCSFSNVTKSGARSTEISANPASSNRRRSRQVQESSTHRHASRYRAHPPRRLSQFRQPVQCRNTHDRIDRIVKWQGHALDTSWMSSQRARRNSRWLTACTQHVLRRQGEFIGRTRNGRPRQTAVSGWLPPARLPGQMKLRQTGRMRHRPASSANSATPGRA